MTLLAYLQWVERKVIAHVQVRPGPYRVGPHGLLQPLADVIKLITKEDLMPPYVNKFFYLLAPFLAVIMALISISVIPFGPTITVVGHPHLDAADRSQHRRAVHSGRSRRWASTASRSPAGRRTTSTRCSAACAVPRR